MSTPTIILYKGQSQYDVLRFFIDDIADGFREYGYRTVVIDLLKPNFVNELMDVLLTVTPLCFFSFNGIGIDLSTADNVRLHDKLGIPFFAFFVDHPVYHGARINLNGVSGANGQIFSFLDRNQINFASRHVEQNSAKIFMPHAASHLNSAEHPVAAIRERKTQIFMPGGYSDPDSKRAVWKSWGPIMSDLVDQLIDCSLAQPELPLADCFDQVLYRKGMASETFYTDRTFELLQVADGYLRSKYRHDLAEELQDFDLHVAGYGWEAFSGNKRKMRISPMLSYEKVIEEMRNSKFVVNAFPTYNQHSHERVFDAGASGAIAITAPSPYFREIFDGRGHVQFLDRFQSAADTVNELLSAPDEMQERADRGRALVLNEHMWRNRAGNVLEHIFIHTNLVQQR